VNVSVNMSIDVNVDVGLSVGLGVIGRAVVSIDKSEYGRERYRKSGRCQIEQVLGMNLCH
jgi:hypothetical protein